MAWQTYTDIKRLPLYITSVKVPANLWDKAHMPIVNKVRCGCSNPYLQHKIREINYIESFK